MVHMKQPWKQQQVQEEEESQAREQRGEEEEITIPSHRQYIKNDRVECMKCHKPAVRYHGAPHDDGSLPIIYEHRDEPPISSYTYPNRGTVHRYRRCFAGTSVDVTQVLQEAGIEPGEEQEVEEEPAASNTIVDVPRIDSSTKRSEGQRNKIRYDKPTNHHATGLEIYSQLRSLRKEHTAMRDEQKRILKSMNAIQSILEMMVKGSLELVPKSSGGNNDGIQ